MMRIISRFFLSIFILVATLVFEVLLAISIYMYIELSHQRFSGILVSYAGAAQRAMADGLEMVAPNLVIQANTSFLGEVSPKAFLLLLIGLFASGVLRVIVWTAKGYRAYRASRRAEA